MTDALAARASDLPAVARAKAVAGMDVFARSTAKALQNGALAAATGAVEHAISTLRSNAYDPQLVLTGGDASRILGCLEEPALHRPHLVLEGLARMLGDER